MIWITAITLVLSVCAGIGAYVVNIIGAFNTLSSTGSADPAELANDISNALILTLIAAPFALASLVLFVIAIIRHRKFSNPSHVGT